MQGPGPWVIDAIEEFSLPRGQIVFYDQTAAWAKSGPASAKKVYKMAVRKLAGHPLDPDEIVVAWLRAECVQGLDKSFANSGIALRANVGRGTLDELFNKIHHVHGVESRQQ